MDGWGENGWMRHGKAAGPKLQTRGVRTQG